MKVFFTQHQCKSVGAMVQEKNYLPACPTFTMGDQISRPRPLFLACILTKHFNFYKKLSEIGEHFTIF